MEETIVFIDEGFLDKLTRYFGNGKRLKFDKIKFAKLLANRQNFFCKKLFYYTCPPFQSDRPTPDEAKRKRGYDRFISSLMKYQLVKVREGRCQRLRINNNFEFYQKGVDTLLALDLGNIKNDYPKIKKVILVSSDSDFSPIIKYVRNLGVEVILYSYFDKKRNSKFSLSNELIDVCSMFVKLTREDFIKCRL